jgi:hypothetical protein
MKEKPAYSSDLHDIDVAVGDDGHGGLALGRDLRDEHEGRHVAALGHGALDRVRHQRQEVAARERVPAPRPPGQAVATRLLIRRVQIGSQTHTLTHTRARACTSTYVRMYV